MESAIAFGIFLAIVGYFIARSNDKEKAKEMQSAHAESDKIREDTKVAIHSQAIKHGIDFNDEQLSWVCSEIESEHGKSGLITVKDRFESAKSDELKRLLEMIEVGYQNHIEETEIATLKDEADRKWRAVLDDFKRMNPAQQKKHLAYIKKNTNELSEEQLHILELISLSDNSKPSETDVMIGDMKLFTMRKR